MLLGKVHLLILDKNLSQYPMNSKAKLKEDLREIKKNQEFSSKREEILSMIWDMEEEIMGKED